MSDEGSITFVPSVHFSPIHRRRTRETIREVRPDVVAVELDERRFDRLERSQTVSPAELARELPPATGAMYATFQWVQRTVVRLYGLDPTKTEMETAIETAAELDTEIALIDDSLTETFAALSRRIGLDTLPKVAMRAQTMGPEYYATQLELLTQPVSEIDRGDDVQPAIDQMRRLLPEVTEVLIDRRDRAMARRLHRLRREGNDVVAVIGAGHHNGISAHLEALADEGADLAYHESGGDVDVDGSDGFDGVAADDADEVVVPRRRSSREVTRIPIE
ncbi:TraB domain-containing protein [Natrialbaceae archaeon GCM10025810]|uniref:TraB domain-containing protein n=1 Tax=Halovalidus salilacus TaxID=3075124 RepID=UPI0036094F2B